MPNKGWAATAALNNRATTSALASTIAELGAPSSLEAGEQLPAGQARYDRGPLLGEGGMGRVVQAKDRQFGRVVALKEVLRRSPGLEARFAYETVVTANLEHPGIPPVYERGRTEDGLPFYTMRLVQGRTLAAAIDEALRASSTFREQGFGAWVVLFFSQLGLVLGSLEWITRGRLKLMPLAIVLAVSTFVGSLGATFVSLGIAARYATTRPADQMLRTALQGLYEAAGNLGYGSGLAILQALLLAVVWRSLTMNREGAR